MPPPTGSLPAEGPAPLSGFPVNDNHPVLFALDAEREALQATYRREPNEHNRYQLVRLESLIAQWAPQRAAAN
ncbi:MAG: hypothetical protein FJ054_05075 [Cyanobacteria bacterium M_surface_10_m2_119]|nr:hypothetical protein [Cyanobacteria bacterium M_surface_10_m2_119]